MRPSCKNRLNWPEFTWVINRLTIEDDSNRCSICWLRTVRQYDCCMWSIPILVCNHIILCVKGLILYTAPCLSSGLCLCRFLFMPTWPEVTPVTFGSDLTWDFFNFVFLVLWIWWTVMKTDLPLLVHSELLQPSAWVYYFSGVMKRSSLQSSTSGFRALRFLASLEVSLQ